MPKGASDKNAPKRKAAHSGCALLAAVMLCGCSAENETNVYIGTDETGETKIETEHNSDQLTSSEPDEAAERSDNNPATGPCYDVTAEQPEMLVGELAYHIFPGPPNYEDVQTGDTPEPAYILMLDESICIVDGEDGFADPDEKFSVVHLVPTEQVKLRGLTGEKVLVGLTQQMAAQTGHHRAPLVAWVNAVEVLEDQEVDEFLAEYGTAATTVRAFYDALSSGQGQIAARYVVPEKTRSGAFAPANMTKFYSNMREPLRMVRLEKLSHDSFVVHYRYAVTRSVCKGRAEVQTTSRGGRNYIQSIKALDGC